MHYNLIEETSSNLGIGSVGSAFTIGLTEKGHPKGKKDVALTDPQPVEEHYEAAELPERYMVLDQIGDLYLCLKSVEEWCEVVQVVFYEDQCVVIFDELCKTFPVTITSSNEQRDLQSSIVVKSFTCLYETLPVPKPNLYYDGREFVEEARTDDGNLVARIRYRLEFPDPELGLAKFLNGGWSGRVRPEALFALRQLEDRCLSPFRKSGVRVQIHRGRADVPDLLVIKTEGEAPVFHVDLCLINLLDNFRSEGPSVEFSLSGRQFNIALGTAIKGTELEPQKIFYIHLDYAMRQLSFYKWSKVEGRYHDVDLTDPQPVQVDYEPADLPYRYMNMHHLSNMYLHIYGLEDLMDEYDIEDREVLVSFGDDVCKVTFNCYGVELWSAKFDVERIDDGEVHPSIGEVHTRMPIGEFLRLYQCLCRIYTLMGTSLCMT